MKKPLLHYLDRPNKSSRQHIDLCQAEVSGGRIERSEIDRAVARRKEATEVAISGLTQDTFEYFVGEYGDRFEVIHFWKCPRIGNFQCLEQLVGLKVVTIFWNQRAESFWNFSKTSSLIGFGFHDCRRVRDISGVAEAHSLLELEFGDRHWNRWVCESLKPLSGCKKLTSLGFTAKSIIDKDIVPLGSLTNLRALRLPSRLFSTLQIAWLRARLPASLESQSIDACIHLKRPIQLENKKVDVLVSGKGKPFLDSKADQKRLARYVEEFNIARRWFEDHPKALPEHFHA